MRSSSLSLQSTDDMAGDGSSATGSDGGGAHSTSSSVSTVSMAGGPNSDSEGAAAAAAASTNPAAAADTTYIHQAARSSTSCDGAEDAPLVTSADGGRTHRKPAPQHYLSNAPLPHIYDSDDEDDMIQVHRTRPRRIGGFSFLPHASPRPILLGLSLSLTLATFWLLDSVKDPLFAALVDGNLSHHQPRAKICSVLGTLCIVIAMEVVGNRRKQRYAQRHVTEQEIMDGGGNWSKMNVADSLSGGYEADGCDDGEESGTRIPSSIFRAVGGAYFAAFAIAAIILSRYTEPETSAGSTEPPMRIEWRILGYMIYLLVESYGSITVACFWAYANSTLTVTAAERYYGTIVALAQLGAIGGSTVAASKTKDSGGVSDVAPLFGVACVGVLLQVSITVVYATVFPRPMKPEDDDMTAAADDDADIASFDHMKILPRGRKATGTISGAPNGSVGDGAPINGARDMCETTTGCTAMLHKIATYPALSGLYLILKHRYVLLILGVSCLYEISLTCLDYEMKLIGLDRFGEDSLRNDASKSGASVALEAAAPGFHTYIANTFAQFMGRYGQLTNMMSLILSFFAFPYLMKTRGLRSTLRIFPSLLVFVSILTYMALPMNLPVLFVSVSLLKAMTYSINDPAKEILYIPTSDAIKFRAKFWIDVVGARIAKALASSINTYAGSADRIVQYGTIPSVITSLGLFAVCYWVGIEFDGLLERGQVVGSGDEDITDDSYGIIGGEIATYEAEQGMLLGDDDEVVIESLKGRCGNNGKGDGNGGPSIELVAQLS